MEEDVPHRKKAEKLHRDMMRALRDPTSELNETIREGREEVSRVPVGGCAMGQNAGPVMATQRPQGLEEDHKDGQKKGHQGGHHQHKTRGSADHENAGGLHLEDRRLGTNQTSDSTG